MAKYGLPLCPCGSGKLYEECCYKKKGADGEPLFFKGAFKSSDGNIWHPIPNVRFSAIIVGQSIDKYRECASFVLPGNKLDKIIDMVKNLEKLESLHPLMDLIRMEH